MTTPQNEVMWPRAARVRSVAPHCATLLQRGSTLQPKAPAASIYPNIHSLKSFQRKDGKPPALPDDLGNAKVDFHDEKRSNETHQSKTDPDAKLARKGKGKEAKLSYNGNLLVEDRNGLIVNTEVVAPRHDKPAPTGIGS